jgi:hypothetical protein
VGTGGRDAAHIHHKEPAMTRNDLTIARRIARLADQGGTIQAAQLVRVMRDPRDHRCMSIREAWSILLPHLDADDIAEALWA